VGKALDHASFADYARARIQAAHDIHQRHHPSRIGLCTCGRPQPCAVVTACAAIIAHYRGKLAIIGATLPLSVITPRTTSDRPTR
jgi:hypothetical protein